MKVYINGQQTTLPAQPIGGGGEASVYLLNPTTVAKVFHLPDQNTSKNQKKAMAIKIALQQKKLPSFPKGLPKNVVIPQDMITDRNGKIIGYTMPLINQAELWVQYVNPGRRITDKQNNEITKSLLALYDTINGLHQKGVVIGDCNDLNIMVQPGNIYMIDADSYQWGNFPCDTFTQKYVDPLLCVKDPNANQLMLHKHHNDMSDWYAYSIMWMESLMLGGPYAGIYKPKDQSKKIPETLRPLHRVTIFDPEVKRPKIIMPDETLPDDLLHYFFQTFVKDIRVLPDRKLLENTKWQTCTQCGSYHARHTCPTCSHVTAPQIKQTIKVYGTIIASTIFQTTGTIVHATIQDGKLLYLVHEDGVFKREGNRHILDGNPLLGMKYGIVRNTSYISHGNNLVAIDQNGTIAKPIKVERYQGHPMITTNSRHAYWIERDHIVRNDDLAPRSLGNILPEKTAFWTGETFGIGIEGVPGFYMPFIFDTKHKSLNDTVKLPDLNGRLLDGFATFTDKRVWLWLITEEKKQTYYHLYLLDNLGTLIGALHEQHDVKQWMSNIRGKYAIGEYCFAPTDEGVVRLACENGIIFEEKAFPDTEQWVSAHTRLLIGTDGIYAINEKSITQLKTQ